MGASCSHCADAQVLKDRREAESMNQTETKRHQPTPRQLPVEQILNTDEDN